MLVQAVREPVKPITHLPEPRSIVLPRYLLHIAQMVEAKVHANRLHLALLLVAKVNIQIAGGILLVLPPVTEQKLVNLEGKLPVDLHVPLVLFED